MKTIKTVAIIALAGIFAAGSPALAEKKEGGKEGKRPGKPGGERRGGPPGGIMKFMDSNEDGSISRAEFDAAQEKRVARMKERLGDKFNLDEAADRANMMFTKLDADKSGSISKEEAAKAPFGRRGGPGGGPGKGGPGRDGKGHDHSKGKGKGHEHGEGKEHHKGGKGDKDGA